jgi:hypothetical protein
MGATELWEPLLQRHPGFFAPDALAVYGMASENPENKGIRVCSKYLRCGSNKNVCPSVEDYVG